MTQEPVGRPFYLVAALLFDEEGLAAADVAVGVEAGFDGEVEDAAGGDGGVYAGLGVRQNIYGGGEREG